MSKSKTAKLFDVDIDVTSSSCKKGKYGVRAFVYNEKTRRISQHPSGTYLEEVPIDMMTGMAAFDYKYGDEAGYYKVDLLTNNAYNNIKSKSELLELVDMETPWEKFLDEEFVSRLPHIANHFEIVRKVGPRSIEDLADILALIRPGKAEMIDSYLESKISTRRNLYRKPTNGKIYFKKSHAIGYAVMITVVAKKLVLSSGIIW